MEKPEGWKAKGKGILLLFPLTGLKTQIYGTKLPAFLKFASHGLHFFLTDTFEFCKLTKGGGGVAWIKWKAK